MVGWCNIPWNTANCSGRITAHCVQWVVTSSHWHRNNATLQLEHTPKWLFRRLWSRCECMHYEWIFNGCPTIWTFDCRRKIFVSHIAWEWWCSFCFVSFFHFHNNKSHIFCSMHKGNGEDEVIEIPDVMFNTGRLRQRNFYDEILLTLERQPLQQVDSVISQGVSGSSIYCHFTFRLLFITLSVSFEKTIQESSTLWMWFSILFLVK